MLDKLQHLSKLFQKKVMKTPGLLSIYIGVGFITLAYTKKRANRPVINVAERINIEQTTLESVLVSFMAEHGFENLQCVVTLNPTDYRLIYLDAPNVNDEELGGAAKWLVKEFINFPLSNAAVDAFRVPVREGQPAKMYAVVAQLDRIKAIVDACEKATLEVIAIDIAELSLRNLMQLLQEENAEVGLLFMRPDFHSILISADNTLRFSRSIDSKAPYQSTNAQDDAKSIQYLVNEIERSIHFYQSNMGNSSLKKIWISTEFDNQQALVDALHKNDSITFEALDFSTYFKSEEEEADLSTAVQSAIALSGLLRQE